MKFEKSGTIYSVAEDVWNDINIYCRVLELVGRSGSNKAFNGLNVTKINAINLLKLALDNEVINEATYVFLKYRIMVAYKDNYCYLKNTGFNYKNVMWGV